MSASVNDSLVFNLGAQRPEVEAKSQQLCDVDLLTKLSNRTAFHMRLTDAMRNSQRTGHSIAVHLLNLDYFKKVNDTLGHSAGEKLLRLVGERLSASIRVTDTIARMGGDEFAIIQTHLDYESGVEILVRRLLQQLATPFTLQGQNVQIGASIGIALYPSDGIKTDDLLYKASLALRRAKKEGRSEFRLYDQVLDQSTKSQEALVSDLSAADATRNLVITYKPKADFTTGNIVGAEALVSWQHPKWGMAFPKKMIMTSEEKKFNLHITNFLLEQVAADLSSWPRELPHDFKISIKLSALDLERCDFVDWLTNNLREFDAISKHLEFEFYESILISNDDMIQRNLMKLRNLGIYVSICNFGANVSPNLQPTNLPFDCIKISETFLSDVLSDTSNARKIKSAIAMARGIGLRVVADRVETEKHADFLLRQGCNEIQRNYLADEMLFEKFLCLYLQQNNS
jgi:diguanylate cyclase (GGDEF)-like protein